MWTPPPVLSFPDDVDAERNVHHSTSGDPPTLEETRRAVNELKIVIFQKIVKFCLKYLHNVTVRKKGEGEPCVDENKRHIDHVC